MLVKRILLLSIVFILQACSPDVELPVASPLSATARQLAALYKFGYGPLLTQTTQVSLSLEDEGKLALTATYPDADGTFPLLIFSHGNWSTKDKYQGIIKHWVSHGYIVLSPNHDDCCSMIQGIFYSVWYGQLGLIERRVESVKLLMDNLDLVEAAIPALEQKIDRDRIALAGHSFGAFTAQQFIGAGVFDPHVGRFKYYRDDRIKAVVAISPPGPMFDSITEKSWMEVDRPMLVTTGTWDVNASFWPDWRLHKMSFDTAKPDDKFAVVIQGADHYFGNLICRPERDALPQKNALKMLNTTAVAFLDAYVKDKRVAKEFLKSGELDVVTANFAVIEQR